MKIKRFTESQMEAILEESGSGILIAEVCRKHGISAPTYYQWKSKYGGMLLSELKRVKGFEAENAKLKRMYAELALGNMVLRTYCPESSSAVSETSGSRCNGDRTSAVASQSLQTSRYIEGGAIQRTSRLC